jgi:hypothetical protein
VRWHGRSRSRIGGPRHNECNEDGDDKKRERKEKKKRRRGGKTAFYGWQAKRAVVEAVRY